MIFLIEYLDGSVPLHEDSHGSLYSNLSALSEVPTKTKKIKLEAIVTSANYVCHSTTGLIHHESK